jgi:hypothetical protein
MSPECEAGQRQVHIVTPIPLPYIAPSTAVLQSMMRKELKGTDYHSYQRSYAQPCIDKKAPSPDIPLLEDLVPLFPMQLRAF